MQQNNNYFKKMSLNQVSEAKIILHFDVHKPVELMELTLAFGSFARQYKKFLSEKSKSEGKKVYDSDVKLFITKIDNNCILTELSGATEILGTLFSLMDYSNIFIDFVRNVDGAISYFRSLVKKEKIDSSEIPYSKRQCEDLANFLDVVSGAEGNLGIKVSEFNKKTGEEELKVKFTYKSDEAFEAKKGALIALNLLDYKGAADYENVLMYFFQTNTDESKAEGKTAEKAIIKSISLKELPVYFISALDRERIYSLKANPTLNPFKACYRVDVNVETNRKDAPVFYRVLRLHEIIPENEDSSES